MAASRVVVRYLVIKSRIRIDGFCPQDAVDEICDAVSSELNYSVTYDDVVDDGVNSVRAKIIETEVVGFLDSPPLGT